MSKLRRKILFYNAIPMPHSIKIHEILIESGYHIEFWYYKDLTSLYPWSTLKTTYPYRVYGTKGNNLYILFKEAWNSDLIIITGFHTYIHVLLALFCFILNIKYAYWLDVPEKPKASFKTRIKKILLKMTDYLLVTGIEGIERITDWYKIDKNKAVDFPYLSTEINDHIIDESNKNRLFYLSSGSKIKVLISNRFEKRKGYECIYKALKGLPEKLIDRFSFTIIGSGSDFETYKRLFNEIKLDLNFRFWVEYDEYINLIRSNDILIHASLHEPFGIPPIDAMAHGKLVIASDGVMSTYNRIKDGENGFVFKSGDHEGLAIILSSIANNFQLIYHLGSKARKDSRIYSPIYNIKVIQDLLF